MTRPQRRSSLRWSAVAFAEFTLAEKKAGYDLAEQETIYYAQTHRGDVVSLTSEDGRLLETVRYTAYGVPRVFRLDVNPCDIADDQGNPLWHGMSMTTDVANSGVNEGDYNAFFDGYFTALPHCDIADDQNNPLSMGQPIVPGVGNSGVNEGDYNLFFMYYFDQPYPSEITDDSELEWGVLSFNDQVRNQPQTGNRIGYAGYWWDETLNMYYVRNRWYMPRTGRWLTPDPIGFAGGSNLFEYCSGKPTNFIDPFGLEQMFPGWTRESHDAFLARARANPNMRGGNDAVERQVISSAWNQGFAEGAARNPAALANFVVHVTTDGYVMTGWAIGIVSDDFMVQNTLLGQITYNATMAGDGNTGKGLLIMGQTVGENIGRTFVAAAHGDLTAIGDISWNVGLGVLMAPSAVPRAAGFIFRGAVNGVIPLRLVPTAVLRAGFKATGGKWARAGAAAGVAAEVTESAARAARAAEALGDGCGGCPSAASMVSLSDAAVRAAYEAEVRGINQIARQALEAGLSEEAVARMVHQIR